jgi:hypothetical protein
MALKNPSQAPRIVPYGTNRLASDKLPNGRWAFRVTQRFADIDKYFGGKHGALDLGNYECGDKMLASVSGRVANKRDSYGALIVEIRESSGAVVGYGHLSKFAVANGAWVNAGAVIGYVGATGLGGVCHVHYYRRNASGVLVDPWPLLEQNAIKRQARFNGNGTNIRNGPGQVGGALASIWGSTKGGRVIRKDGKDFGALSTYRTARGPTYGATHGIGNHPKSWTPMYINGAYRSVAYPLTTYK